MWDCFLGLFLAYVTGSSICCFFIFVFATEASAKLLTFVMQLSSHVTKLELFFQVKNFMVVNLIDVSELLNF